jgi:hypothetical protein
MQRELTLYLKYKNRHLEASERRTAMSMFPQVESEVTRKIVTQTLSPEDRKTTEGSIQYLVVFKN